jgi:hypothetical protein
MRKAFLFTLIFLLLLFGFGALGGQVKCQRRSEQAYQD